MPHGMRWVCNAILPEQHAGVPVDEAANRLGSWAGLMTQAGHSPGASGFAPGDLKIARLRRHEAGGMGPAYPAAWSSSCSATNSWVSLCRASRKINGRARSCDSRTRTDELR